MECRLIQGDCLKVMPELIEEDTQVDLILTDPPYGTIKGLTLPRTKNFIKEKLEWDTVIDIEKMFYYCEKLLKQSRCCLLFSNHTFSYDLYNHQHNNLPYTYKYIWVKNNWGNAYMVKKAPLSIFEEILVFRKKYDLDMDSELRKYSEYIFNNIGLSKKQIMEKCGNQKLDHFFRFSSMQFSLPTQESYQQLIDLFNIDELDGFIPYDNLYSMGGISVFNLNNNTHKTNILNYDKLPKKLHPAQKPVDLLEDLILTYTNKGDTVLDFTMGSGSTGVACQNTDRNFIGIELENEYFKIAEKRINDVQRRLI